MIDIKELKNNKSFFIKKFNDRGHNLSSEVNYVLEVYNKYLLNLNSEQKLREELNKITKEIKIRPNEVDILKKEAAKISLKAKTVSTKVVSLKEEYEKKLSFFPNPTLDIVSLGESDTNNDIISTFLDKEKKKTNILHWEWLEKKKLISNEESAKISGSRHIIYNDKITKLGRALECFFLEEHERKNILNFEVPEIVNEESLFNTGQLPKFRDDLYKLDNNQFLIPTAEVPLVNIFSNKTFLENELPIKVVSLTSCFRKEAGAAGKDTRGLIRLHQFKKVELVTIGKPKDEEKDLNNMIKQVTNLLNLLKLPYRIVRLCSGDTGFSSRITYDIEVWMPGMKKYKEISSISSTGNFQARRMKTKFKKQNGEKEFVYTFNGSALPIGRTIAAIIENNVNESEILEIPKVLNKYLSFKKI